jgi:hypothetical protein
MSRQGDRFQPRQALHPSVLLQQPNFFGLHQLHRSGRKILVKW